MLFYTFLYCLFIIRRKTVGKLSKIVKNKWLSTVQHQSWTTALPLTSTTTQFNKYKNSSNSDCLINQNVYYTIYSTTVSFYLPLSVMLFMYYKIYREASRFSLKEDNRKRCLKAHEVLFTFFDLKIFFIKK